jgi:prepilin-type N-terminal cleavage/methylation domain-containing protein
MKKSQAARRTARGFSLTELMIVITISGILLAVSTPAISRYVSSWRLGGAASQMATAMRSARSTAVNKNISTVFVFDQDTGEYYVIEDTNSDGDADAGELQSASRELPPGIVIENFTVPQTSVTFSSRGSTADGGTIVMKGKYDREVTVRVYGGTGNIVVERAGAI